MLPTILRHFSKNDKLTILKLKLINMYIEPIFLYNSGTCTLAKSMEESIKMFWRRINRRYCFNIKMPKNSQKSRSLRENENCWIEQKSYTRLKWFGKWQEQRDSSQVCIKVWVRLSNYAQPWGKPKTTWISKVKEKLNEINLSWLEAENLAIETHNDWLRTIKQYFDIWLL